MHGFNNQRSLVVLLGWIFPVLLLLQNNVNIAKAVEEFTIIDHHGDNNQEESVPVSYVMEPFEGIHPDWFQDDFLSLGLTGREKLFGNRSLQVEYYAMPTISTADAGQVQGQVQNQSMAFGWILQEPRAHNCYGATHVSLWYKHKQGRSLPEHQTSTIQLQVTLLDDSQCRRLADNDCTRQENLVAYTTTHNVTFGEWQELIVPLELQDQFMFNPRRIRGWKITIVVTNQQEAMAGVVWVDHLACIGDGSLLSSVFHVGPQQSQQQQQQPQQQTFNNILEEGTWFAEYFQSETAQNESHISLPIDDTINNSNQTNLMMVNYTVQMVELWGGFNDIGFLAPGPAYFNLSQANHLVLEYTILQPASVPNMMLFRILLQDASDCPGPYLCNTDKKSSERHYSFNSILDDPITPPGQTGRLALPLDSSIHPGRSFWLSGWSGTMGNGRLDTSIIKGITLEFIVNAGFEQGESISGAMAINKLSVTNQEPIDIARDGSCVAEAGIIGDFYGTNFTYKWIEYHGPETCCAVCESDPDCLYYFNDYYDCFVVSAIEPESIHVPNNDEETLWYKMFWMDDVKKRGDFCDRCDCRESDRTIDCRGVDLPILPKTFAKNSSWAPRRLDLRENDRLVVIGSGALMAIADSLEELWFPSNLLFLPSSWSLKELPKLKKVHFEGKDDGSDTNDVEDATAVLNFITHPNGAFSDVCCGRSNHMDLSEPVAGIDFCNLTVSLDYGTDVVFLPFQAYPFAKAFKRIDENSPLLSEATESVWKCAEYCTMFPECLFFEYDQRLPNAMHTCSLLEDEGPQGLTEICCDEDHYADVNQTVPGIISGWPPRTRNKFDNARVVISPQNIIVSEDNGYSTEYKVSLGSTPLRGAVWIEPSIKSGNITGMDVTISPSRVVLYDSEDEVTVHVHVQGVTRGSTYSAVVIQNTIEACDVAFTFFSSSGDNTEFAVYVEVRVPPNDGSVNLAAAIVTPIVLVIFAALLIYLYLQKKQMKNDAVWQVNNDELKFGDPPEILGRGTFGLVLLGEYRGTRVAVKRVIPPKKSVTRSATKTSSGEFKNSSFDFVEDALEPGDHTNNMGTSSWAGSKLTSASGTNSSDNIKSKGSTHAMSSGSGVIGGLYIGTMNQSQNAVWNKLKSDFIREMRHVSKLRHPCVVTVMGAVFSRHTEPMLVMECMDHGSLFDLLHNDTVLIEGEILLPMIRDITQGMRFLHSANPPIIHGDLKAANVLVDQKFRAKVADFGLSQKRHMGATGTPYWMAPELLRGEGANTTASDVYSMGVIFYEVYSRSEPYEGEDPVKVLAEVADAKIKRHLPVPPACPARVQSLMLDCLCAEPSKRPSFEELDQRLQRVDAQSFEPDQDNDKFRRRGGTSISLYDLFPKHIARALQEGRAIEPEHHDMVTVFFSDIVGYTTLSATLPPAKVADMLDRLYFSFDQLSRKHDVFKMETIGDAYIAVTNLVEKQTNDHAKRIAEFSVEALDAARTTLIDTDDPSKGTVNIRIGFHSGPVVADVVGNRSPKFVILGDTVNTASRMESNSKANRINCSARSAEILQKQHPGLRLVSRGMIPIKGKGEMNCFWVGEPLMEEPKLPEEQAEALVVVVAVEEGTGCTNDPAGLIVKILDSNSSNNEDGSEPSKEAPLADTDKPIVSSGMATDTGAGGPDYMV